MSEQYRCSECGHFVEILDDAICDVCNIGKMQHLRYIRGGDGSHWDGCAEVHWDCKIAQLEAELARRDEELALTEKKLCNIDRSARAEIARRDEIIARLKEDGERLANAYSYTDSVGETECVYCGEFIGEIHDPACPITLHRALMQELEG